jgi:boron transporter
MPPPAAGAACRILAPSVYIFSASVIPALAFGEQIDEETHGFFNGVHVLIATAIAGVTQALIGGQPLLIIGVAEPIILVYGFMYKFADNEGFRDAFLPWCTWTMIWTTLMLLALSVTGAPRSVGSVRSLRSRAWPARQRLRSELRPSMARKPLGGLALLGDKQ